MLQANTLAVGCNDVGQFISYHTMGRQIIGGKSLAILECNMNVKLSICPVD